jgi:hypothetical protein
LPCSAQTRCLPPSQRARRSPNRLGAAYAALGTASAEKNRAHSTRKASSSTASPARLPGAAVRCGRRGCGCRQGVGANGRVSRPRRRFGWRTRPRLCRCWPARPRRSGTKPSTRCGPSGRVTVVALACRQGGRRGPGCHGWVRVSSDANEAFADLRVLQLRAHRRRLLAAGRTVPDRARRCAAEPRHLSGVRLQARTQLTGRAVARRPIVTSGCSDRRRG